MAVAGSKRWDQTPFRFRNLRKRFRSSTLHLTPAFQGRILGRNWDNILKIFPPCYSQSPLLTDLRTSPPPLSKIVLKLVCNVRHCIRKPHVWELSRLCPETSTKLYVHEFDFCTWSLTSSAWGSKAFASLKWAARINAVTVLICRLSIILITPWP